MSNVRDEKSGYPAIRFKGFDDAWVQRKVGDLASDTFGGGTPKTDVTEYWQGNTPWIQSSDIKQDDVLNEYSGKKITDEGVKNSTTKLIPGRSIAIVTRVGVGKLTFIRYPYATSQDFLSLSGLTNDAMFTVYLLYRLLKNEANNAQGTSIKGITKSVLINKDVKIPNAQDEQARIGHVLEHLDALIAVNQRHTTKILIFI